MEEEVVIKDFKEFLKKLDRLGDDCLEVAKDTITKEAEETHQRILDNLEFSHSGGTGGLANSLKMTEIEKNKQASGKFGYKLEFDGYDKDGRPYQLIANTLNRGNAQKKIMPSYFEDNSFKPLSGLSDRIIDAVDNFVDSQDLDK